MLYNQKDISEFVAVWR